MFNNDTKLKKIDMSSFDYSGISSDKYVNMFGNVPTTTEIIVKDCTQYNLLTTGTGRTAGIRTITNMSTECSSS